MGQILPEKNVMSVQGFLLPPALCRYSVISESKIFIHELSLWSVIRLLYKMDSEQVTSGSPFLLKKESRDRFEDEYLSRPICIAPWFQRNKNCIFSNVVVIAVCAILGVIYQDWYLARLHCSPQTLVYSEAYLLVHRSPY